MLCPDSSISSLHIVFGAHYAVGQGLCLHEAPLVAFEEQLLNTESYADTHLVGQNIRAAGIEAFEYRSARDPDRGINIALFHAKTFAEPKPAWQQPWIGDTRDDEVSFYSKEQGTWLFQRVQFIVDGELPTPSV